MPENQTERDKSIEAVALQLYRSTTHLSEEERIAEMEKFHLCWKTVRGVHPSKH